MGEKDIILYHYTFSPYAKRIVWYLTLNGIPYTQCLQPPTLPRPDVARLGVSYRRIPIMSIGRDVYLDTRLQLEKLEARQPDAAKTSKSSAEAQALQQLLSVVVIDGGVFSRAAQLIPPELPLLKDPKFQKDRTEYSGRDWSAEALRRCRPEALTEIAKFMSFLEDGLLRDGRQWILNTKEPSLADIEAVWPLDWLSGLPGALPAETFSAKTYPRVYAWMGRFQSAVREAKKKVGKVETLKGEEAARRIRGSAWNEEEGQVDEADAVARHQELRKGDEVKVWPTDTGSSHRDQGRLVGLDATETVIKIGDGQDAVRVHAPRHGFRVEKVGSTARL